jgi:hypothetical protein
MPEAARMPGMGATAERPHGRTSFFRTVCGASASDGCLDLDYLERGPRVHMCGCMSARPACSKLFTKRLKG